MSIFTEMMKQLFGEKNEESSNESVAKVLALTEMEEDLVPVKIRLRNESKEMKELIENAYQNKFGINQERILVYRSMDSHIKIHMTYKGVLEFSLKGEKIWINCTANDIFDVLFVEYLFCEKIDTRDHYKKMAKKAKLFRDFMKIISRKNESESTEEAD